MNVNPSTAESVWDLLVVFGVGSFLLPQCQSKCEVAKLATEVALVQYEPPKQ